jgi:hypothetical protein
MGMPVKDIFYADPHIFSDKVSKFRVNDSTRYNAAARNL